jgi:site-specific recombinase XerD
MADAEKLLVEYLDYLEIEKNRSVLTRENYERYLRSFFAAQKVKNLSDITEGVVRAFRLSLARKRGRGGRALKRVTQAYYAIAIRNFLKYLIKRGYDVLSPDAIELPKVGDRQIRVLEYADLERILKAPNGGDVRALRDKAILEFLFSTGLRISELCALDRYLDFSRGEVSVRGKGDKLRVVFVSDGARRALADYTKKRGDVEGALFVSLTRGGKVIGRITPRAVQRMIDHYARAAGITERITPHSFRHLFATDLLINGADLRSVQELLGHSNVATTQVYTHLTNKQLKEIHKAFHGRRRK